MSQPPSQGLGAPALPALSSLLALPDEIFRRVYTYLCPLNTVVGAAGYGSEDARALAATNSRLNRLYRCEFVLRLDPPVGATDDEVKHALCRYPRISELYLVEWPPVSDVDAYDPARLRVLNLKSRRRVATQLDSLSELLGMCSDLEELCINLGGPEERGTFDEQLEDAVAAVPLRLRVLHLHQPSIVDTACLRLGELNALQELDLTDCSTVGGLTFSAIAMLPALAKLCLARTSFSDAHAARILPQMQALRDLDVEYCHGISAGLWGVLPPDLTALNGSGTAIFDVDCAGDCGHKSLRDLHVREPRYHSLMNWTALVGNFCTLRVLRLEYSEELQDTGVRDALLAMQYLEILDLNGCSSISTPTFDAIATLPALTKLTLSGTNISDADAARCLPQLHALQFLNVSFCNDVGAGLWEALPPSLTVLYANITTILDGEVGNRIHPKRLRELHAFFPKPQGPPRATRASWVSLASHFGELRRLSVGGWGIGNCGVSDALRAMPLLEELKACNCGLSGDEAAFAVSRHPALRRVDFSGNSIGSDGVHALRHWESLYRSGYRKADI